MLNYAKKVPVAKWERVLSNPDSYKDKIYVGLQWQNESLDLKFSTMESACILGDFAYVIKSKTGNNLGYNNPITFKLLDPTTMEAFRFRVKGMLGVDHSYYGEPSERKGGDL